MKGMDANRIIRTGARQLAEFLNHPERLSEKGQEELSNIRDLLLELVDLERTINVLDEAWSNDTFDHFLAQRESINKRLARYSWVEQLFWIDGKHGRIELYFDSDPADTEAWLERDEIEKIKQEPNKVKQARMEQERRREIYSHLFPSSMSHTVIQLAEHGLLQRVRPCEVCNTWFFGKGIYCPSGKCKQKAYRSKPGFREHHKEYQRDRYHWPSERRKRARAKKERERQKKRRAV